jgi:PIN domain nuclease of toxin-antitoxin system
VKYLLDSCTLLWLAEGKPLLSTTARAIIADPDNAGAVSVISFWELSMKSVVGKLALPMPPAELERLVILEGLTVLPVTIAHVDQFHRLPTNHRDAFDRLIAAVAQVGGYTVLSPDTAFDSLGTARVW